MPKCWGAGTRSHNLTSSCSGGNGKLPPEQEEVRALKVQVEKLQMKKEIAFFSAVDSAISKFTSIDKRRADEDKNSALKQIIDNAIIADGVTDVFDLVGLDKPNIGLLSDEFLEDIKNLPQKNLAPCPFFAVDTNV